MRDHRILVTTFCAAFALPACGGASSPAPATEAMPAATDAPESGTANADLAAQSQATLKTALASYQAINDKNVDAIAALLAPELKRQSLDVLEEKPPQSREQYLEAIKSLSSMHGQKTTSLVTLANGTRSASLYHFTIGPNYAAIFAEASVHDGDGKIVSINDYLDALTMLHQSGARPDELSPNPEPPWATTHQAAATGSATEAANLELFRKLGEIDATGDVETAVSLVSDDFVFRAIPEKHTYRGKEPFRKLLQGRFAALSSTNALDSMWAAGDWVVIEYRPTIEFKVGPAKGKPLTHHAIAFGRVADGKIAEMYIYYNRAPIAMVLGQTTLEELKAAGQKMREMLARQEAARAK